MNRIIILMIVLVGLTESLFPGSPDEYRANCRNRDMKGCYQLGLAYARGEGIGQNIKIARSYLQLSCDEGIVDACTALLSLPVGDTESLSGGSGSNIAPTKEEKMLAEYNGNMVHYFNERFGFTLAYPGDIFRQKILSDNGDGIALYNQDRTLELRAYGSWYGDNIKEIYRDELGWAKESGQRVTYKVFKKNWFVLSGIDRKKQTIFYQKTYFKEGKSFGFRLTYPVRDKKKYDSLVSTISKNFESKK